MGRISSLSSERLWIIRPMKRCAGGEGILRVILAVILLGTTV